MAPELQAELDDARAMICRIVQELDADNITTASYFASELAQTLYKANQIDLKEPAL
jgi:hypothetical protein